MRKHYDAVIVGAGVTGAIMAKILSEGGKDVLILEAGIEGAMDPENYRKYLTKLYTEGGVRGMPNGPYPWNSAAPSPAIPSAPNLKHEEDPYFVFKTKKHFMSDYLRMLGGTTLHWQGTSLRMVPNDFKMNTVYGRGRDWPITYDDLESAYRRAEYEMGVCADVEDQRFFGPFPDGYVYPMHKMPQSRVDQFFKKTIENQKVKLAGDKYKMKVISIPVARNSTPNAAYRINAGYDPVSAVGNRDSGLRCQGNSSCMPICPVQAKYSALKTLNQLNERGNVDIRTQCVVSRLIIDKETNKISEVEYKHYENPDSSKHTPHKVRGTIVVLAANAIENSTLLLASNAANSSDQVGRNLMDHPYLYTWGYSKHKRVYPFRGPDTTSGMESLRDGKFRKVHASFRASLSNWGWSGEPGGQLSDLMNHKVYGKKLRHELGDRMTRMVKVGFMFEQLPNPENRVTIDKNYLDDMKNYRPILSYGYDSYSLAGIEAAVSNIWKHITKHAKIEDKTNYPDPAPGGYQRVTFNGVSYNIMGSGHIVGTHRMGRSPKDSVTDRNMKTWDHSNLYVVGPGNQVTIGTANPTLTTAALAVRASEAILKEL